MKRMKKIMALMLAAIMMMAMSVTAFAAEGATPAAAGANTLNLISKDLLYELSITHGFVLPSDKKLTDILRAPFYLRLYLTLDNIEDAELTALNQEAFEQKIWDEIIRNNRKRKNNLPTRRENTLVFITKEI